MQLLNAAPRRDHAAPHSEQPLAPLIKTSTPSSRHTRPGDAGAVVSQSVKDGGVRAGEI